VKYFSLLLLTVFLSACVTETSGPEPVPVNPQVALEQRVGLARQYIGVGDWENAKRNLELAADIDPSSPDVLEAFALVFQRTGEFERAERSFDRALALGGGSRIRNNYAAFLFAQGRYRESASVFEAVTNDTLYRGRSQAFVNLGLALLQTGDVQDARASFDRALLMEPRNATALLELTQIALTEGDEDAASRYYERYRQGARRQTARALILGVEIARLQDDVNLEASNMLVLRNLYAETSIFRAWTAAQLEQR
jgi:type IV pilus assembly protein PilF